MSRVVLYTSKEKIVSQERYLYSFGVETGCVPFSFHVLFSWREVSVYRPLQERAWVRRDAGALA